MAIAFTLIETPKRATLTPKLGSLGSLPKTHASTSSFPGVTLLKQRNRAGSTDGHRHSDWISKQLPINRIRPFVQSVQFIASET